MAKENVVPLGKEPSYKASDIVTSIGLAVDVGGGQKLQFQTHVMRDCEPQELRDALDKITNAADWLGAKYALRNLKLQLEQEERALGQFILDRQAVKARHMAQWEESKRQGPFKATESQKQLEQNHENSINGRKQAIETIKKQIGITEAILKDST